MLPQSLNSIDINGGDEEEKVEITQSKFRSNSDLYFRKLFSEGILKGIFLIFYRGVK